MAAIRTARYGVKIRKLRMAALEQQRAIYECPRCGKRKVHRQGYAKWKCAACGVVFAGGAYSPTTAVGATARKALDTLAAKR
jgi:large subunit ribosomal protein L37Ae